MTYIIENANILKEDELFTTSLLVKEGNIAFVGNHFRKYSFMKMNAAPYIMTPTYVLFDSLLNCPTSFLQKKDYFINHFILKGCTTILTYVDVQYEKELQTKLKEKKVDEKRMVRKLINN